MGATASTWKKHLHPGYLWGASRGTGRAGSVASERWKNGISSSGGGEGQAGGAGERAPLRVSGALHNLVTKELLRVEPLSVRSGASLRHRPRGKG